MQSFASSIGSSPSKRKPSMYGCGCGLACSHSPPNTTNSLNQTSNCSAFSIISAFSLGAFVTAIFGIFSSSIWLINSESPFSLRKDVIARFLYSFSFSVHILSRSSSLKSGYKLLNMIGFDPPAMCFRKKSWSIGFRVGFFTDGTFIINS